LSLVCTHLGCTLNVTPVGLVCPCHGSCFDRSGQVLKGPAISPLEKFKVRRYYDRLEICLRPREVA
jgi:Rieske Fe-S protein